MTDSAQSTPVHTDLVTEAKPPPIEVLRSDRLSHYRTEHVFQHYAEAKSVEDFTALAQWANRKGLPYVVLGNGSNVLFVRKRIRSLVIKNDIPPVITELSPTSIEVTSTVSIARVLDWCEKRNLDSSYYLASVPATIGGAVAMNAGRGKKFNKSIFDFVKRVFFIENGEEQSLTKEEIPLDYRKTPFTGVRNRFITRVQFDFPPDELEGRPSRERVQWSKENQDHSAPNCGSVFKFYDAKIMTWFQGKQIGKTRFSAKTLNWLLCNNKTPIPAILLIRLAQLVHKLKKRKILVELILID